VEAVAQRSTAAVNYTGYNNPRYDALLDRIAQTVDAKERNALICAAEKTLNHDRQILPLFVYTHAYLLHPSVKGWQPQYQNLHLLKYLNLGDK
jgi:oligopeptide transport system substrate-binding protein